MRVDARPEGRRVRRAPRPRGGYGSALRDLRGLVLPAGYLAGHVRHLPRRRSCAASGAQPPRQRHDEPAVRLVPGLRHRSRTRAPPARGRAACGPAARCRSTSPPESRPACDCSCLARRGRSGRRTQRRPVHRGHRGPRRCSAAKATTSSRPSRCRCPMPSSAPRRPSSPSTAPSTSSCAPGIQAGDVLTIKGRGVTPLRGTQRGDLRVGVHVVTPTRLDAQGARPHRGLRQAHQGSRAAAGRVPPGAVREAPRPLPQADRPTAMALHFVVDDGARPPSRATVGSPAPRRTTPPRCAACGWRDGDARRWARALAHGRRARRCPARGGRRVHSSHHRRPHPALVLVQALAKGDRDELAIQAATELGVDEIVPWQAARSVSRWEAAKAAKGRARWAGIIREAAKQAIRTWIPEVAAVYYDEAGRASRRTASWCSSRPPPSAQRGGRRSTRPPRHRAAGRPRGRNRRRRTDALRRPGATAVRSARQCCARRRPVRPRSRCSIPASAAGEAASSDCPVDRLGG